MSVCSAQERVRRAETRPLPIPPTPTPAPGPQSLSMLAPASSSPAWPSGTSCVSGWDRIRSYSRTHTSEAAEMGSLPSGSLQSR